MRADRITPQVAFLKLKGIALLESAVLDIGKSRYSFLMLSERFRLTLESEGVILRFPDGSSRRETTDKRQYLRLLKEHSRKAREIADADAVPWPLPAGGVGYLGYETAAAMETLSLADQEDDLNLPDAVFLFGETFLVFDHYKDELTVCTICSEKEQEIGRKRIDGITERLFDFDFRAYQSDESSYAGTFTGHRDKEQFIRGVQQIKEAIVRGDLLQGVLSHRSEVTSDIPPFEAYRRLRRENPSPYMFYINFSDFVLFGASPEVMVSCSGSTAMVKPIAGTRPRGATKKEDMDLEQELLADEKERAEHLMLIDLARNDLNRVCTPGSVRVLHSFSVQRFSHVMHIVSEVEGSLRSDRDIFDLIASAFPAGTVTGAPKIKAMEIVSSLEPKKRGPYAGLVGYLDLHGGIDSCITIRSVVHVGKTFYIQAGAGIVSDSRPEREYEETLSKAQALRVSLGVTDHDSTD